MDYFRLHPFSLRELNRSPSRSDLDALLTFGGFPEPLFSQNVAEHRIWQRDRISRVVREDLRDLEHVREVTAIEHLTDLLPSKVGAPLSVKSLCEDLRDVDKREVDFVVLKGKAPLFAVECKSGEKAMSPAIHYFAERTAIPRFYQTHLGTKHFSAGPVTVLPFARLCEELELP